QRVEILKALSRDARILILDEPTAVLAPSAAAELLKWLRQFADGGRTIVLITHKLRDALAVADDITVLRRGKTVLTTRSADTDEQALTVAMLGVAPAGPAERAGPGTSKPRGAVVLRASHLRVIDDRGVVKIDDANLEAHAGEITGIAAV